MHLKWESGYALFERDAHRLRPAAVGYVVLAVALARYPHQFHPMTSTANSSTAPSALASAVARVTKPC
jgi:hypothetical protein